MRAVDDRHAPRNVRVGRVLAPPLWSFTALLAYKVAYGGLLAASIAVYDPLGADPWDVRIGTYVWRLRGSRPLSQRGV